MNTQINWYDPKGAQRPTKSLASLCAVFILALSITLFPSISTAAEAVCAEVKIEINQELTLERQAFDAVMRINNSLETLSLDNVIIDVLFQDASGNPVLASSDPDSPDAKFFITVDSLQGVDSINGGTILPATTAEVHWLIIPAPGAAETPTGTVYFIGANLSYSYGGVEETVVVAPDFIRVKPLPQITLDYFLEKNVYGDDAFTPAIEPPVPYTLGVRVQNNGTGVAQNVKIESAQPKIIENEQGLLIDFRITDSFVDDAPASPTLLIDFGEIPSGAAKHGRWVMETTLSGLFTEFTASFSHADELGGQLTSLLEGVNAHFLVHDVLVDALGRDNVRDFLAEDAGVLTVYESDNVDTAVTDQSAFSNLVFNTNSGGDSYYDLTMPVTAGLMYASMVDPYDGSKAVKEVIRSDGKRLPVENAWFSKTRKAVPEDGWDYHFNVFDNASSGVYSVVFTDRTIFQQAPIFQFIPDRTTYETNQVSFIVMASDPDGTTPVIYAENLPVGASFIDQANGTALFDWTPNIGQAGLYEITYRATDGALIGTRKAYILVNPVWDTDGDGMDDAWELEHFGNLDRDGTGDFDGDGISDLQEYIDGTSPVGNLTKYWDAPALVDIAATDATNPQVVMAEDGSAISVWSQSDGAVTSIWANYYSPVTGWGATPELVETDDTSNAHSPRIALDDSGNAITVWLQSDGMRDNLWGNYYTNGTGWGTAVLIENDDIGDAGYAQVAMAPDGTAIALWSQADGTLDGGGEAQANTVMTSRYVVATGWEAPARIDSYTPIHAFGTQLSVDALGNIIALWSDSSDGVTYNISTNAYNTGTGWGISALLRAGALGDIDASPLVSARLAMNANGDAVAVWAEASSPASVWASVYPAGTTWGAASQLETSLDAAIQPAVVMDSNGDATAVFAQFDGSRYVVHANRYSAGAWGVDELIGTTSTSSLNSDAAAPQITVDASGNATVVWQQFDGVQSNVWSNRFDFAGSAWEQPLVIETDNAGDVANVEIAMNTGGEAVVVWQQADGISTNIESNTYEQDNAGVPNIVPITNTAIDLVADEQTTVTLDGSASFDQDGAIASFSWIQISGTTVALDTTTTATSGIASFVTPTLTISEDLVFQLTVTDDASAVGTVNTTATVNPVNALPTADAGIDQSVDEQTLVSLVGSGTDSDGTVASYAWTQTGGTTVTLTGAATANASFTAPIVLAPVSPETLMFDLTVTDNEGGITTDTIIVTVNAVNAVPTADAGIDQNVDEQTAVSLVGSGTDSDGTVASYAWTQTSGSAVILTGAATANASFTAPIVLAPVSPETLTFDLTVTDNEGGITTDTIIVTVNAVNTNPTANSGVDQSADEQTAVALSGSGSDADGSVASYNWSQTGGTAVTLTGAATANASFTSPIVLAPVSPETLTFELAVTDNEGGITTDTIVVTVNAVNAVPTANAGIDQSVDEQTLVNLAGSGTDADGTVDSYTWTQTGGTAVTLTGAATVNASFTAPIVLAPVSPDTLTFELSVTDNEGGVTTDTIVVAVNAVNTAPTANAGVDQSINELTAVALTGSGTDIDGTIATYSWTQTGGTAVTLTGAATANANFTAPIVLAPVSPETLTFELSVTDNEGGVTTDSIIVSVNAVNVNPVSDAGMDQGVEEQTAISLTGSGTDSDGTVASYSWSQTSGTVVTLTGATTANASFTSPIVLAPVSPETLTFDLTVTDNEGGITTDSIVVTVNAVNLNPVSDAGTDQSIDEQTAVLLTGSGSDSDGAIDSYSWTQTGGTVVTLAGADTANASFTAPIVLAPVSPETLTFELAVTDNEGGITTDSITVIVNAVNVAPTANAGVDQSVDEQTAVSLTGSGTDSDGTVDSYAWTQTGGTTVTLTGAATANASFTAPIVLAPVSPDTLTFELSVTDNEGGVTTDTIIVTVNAVNASPTADAGVNQSVDEQAAVSLTGSGSDSDGSVASYAWTQTGGTTVTLSGAATANASFTAPIVLAPVSPEALTFDLTVTDNEGGITTDTITITVNAVNAVPTADAGIDQSVDEQTAVALAGSGADSDGTVASYAWTQTGGSAITLTGAATANASFTAPIVLAPVSPETLTFDLTVTDNEGGITTDSITITVNAVNANPTADAGVDQAVDEQTAVALAGSGTDSDGTVASYAWTQTGGTVVALTGASTANASFTAPIVLAPVSPDTLIFELAVTDNEGGVTTDTIVVTVNAVNAAPTADAGIDQSVDEQTAVALIGSSSDADGSVANYAWAQTGGTTVTLAGAATANASFTAPIVLAPVSPETLTFDLTVTDNEGGITTDTIIVTVNAVNAAPTANAGTDQSVDEQTAVALVGSGSDADGTVDSYAWTQSGGTAVTLTGAATANASFTASIVLAPVSPETLTFDLTVTDNEGGITTDTIIITVNAVNAAPTADAGTDQSVDEQTAVSLTGSGSDSDGSVASYSWSQTGGTVVTLTGEDTANASFTSPIVLAPVSPDTLTFDLTVTDNEGGVTTDTIVVTVNAVNAVPTSNAGIDQSVDEQTVVALSGSGTDSDGTVAIYSWSQTGGTAVTLTGASTANSSFTAPIVLAPVSPETLTFDLTVTDNEGGVTTDSITITVNAVNANPTADAGVDQAVDEQTAVALAGSGTDSDGTVASYAWTQTGGTVVALTGASTANASFTAPIVLAPVSPEALTFDLTVTDNEGGITTDTIIITVNAVNAVPTADAGIDQSVDEQTAVALVGSGSDADGSVVSYAWTQTGGTVVTLTGATTANASFTSPIVLAPVSPETLTFDLTVTDNEGGITTDTIVVTVNAVNAAPTANAGVDQSVDEQVAVALAGLGTDSDGTVTSYSWTQTSGTVVTLTGAATTNASFTAPIVLAPVSPETLTFDLTVTDNEGGVTTDTIVITVNAVNATPTANAGIDQSVDEQTAVALVGSGSDADGSVASYSWTQAGGTVVTLTGAATANASFTAPIVLAPVSPETLTFNLTVTDNEGGVTTDSITITVNAVNAVPTANAGIDQSVDEQTAVSLSGSGSDADGSVASYGWTQTGGTVVTLTGATTANASFTAPIVLAPVSPEVLTFDLTVTDNEGGITTDTIAVTVNAVNAAPSSNAGVDQSVNEQTAVALVGSGTDSDGTVATYTWTQTSGTVVILTGASTANASFTSPIVLAPVSPETLTFDLTVTDNEGGITTDTIVITVNAVNATPTANAGIDQSVDEQTLVALVGSGSDADGSVASYGWTQTGGTAVTLTGAATANASFTAPIVLAPVSPEILTFDLTVTDNEGGITTDTIVVTVNAVNASPTANAGIDQSVDEQTAVTMIGSGTDSDGTVASYAWTQTGGTAVILTGAATASASFTAPIVLAPVSPEALTFDLTVTDNEGGVTTDSITITINAINTNPTADAGIDQSVDEQTAVALVGSGTDSDGTIATYSWTQTGGTAVTLTGAGTANASFTAPIVLAPVGPDTLTFELSVTDNEGGVTTDTIVVTVNAVNANPTANAGIDQSVDEQSAVALVGSGSDSDGSVASYSWTQTDGTAVTLTGAATANASFTAPIVLQDTTLIFQLTVYDNEGSSASDSISVIVLSSNPDNDGDGMDDSWEITYFGDTNRDGLGDFDNDGFTDLEEFQNGTDPLVPNIPGPTNLIAVVVDAGVKLTWDPVENATSYNIYWNTEPGVTTQTGQLVDNASNNYLHAGLTSGSIYYYRVTAIVSEVETAPSNEANVLAEIFAWQVPEEIWTKSNIPGGGTVSEFKNRNHVVIKMNSSGEGIAYWRELEPDGLTGTYIVWISHYYPESGWGSPQQAFYRNDLQIYGGAMPYINEAGDRQILTRFVDSGNVLYIQTINYDPVTGWGTPETIVSKTLALVGDYSWANYHIADQDILIDSAGNKIFMWGERRSSSSNLWDVSVSQYIPGSGWGSPEIIFSIYSVNPSLKYITNEYSSDGLVTWIEQEHPNLNLKAGSYDPVNGWVPHGVIENFKGVVSSPGIDTDQNGNALIVWEQLSGNTKKIASNRYDAITGWGVAEYIDNVSVGNGNFTPRVTMNNNDEAFAVWHKKDQGIYSIWANRYDSGVWQGEMVIEEFHNVYWDVQPEVVINQKGGAVVAWHQYLDKTDIDGILKENASIWANSYDASTGTWGKARSIETFAPDFMMAEPYIASDGADNIVTIWSGERGWLGYSVPQRSVVVSHHNLVTNAPVSFAGSDQTVVSGSSVLLDGSNSYSGVSGIDSYYWELISNIEVDITGGDTASPSFVAPTVTSETTLEFQLTVTSGDVTGADNIVVTVLP